MQYLTYIFGPDKHDGDQVYSRDTLEEAREIGERWLCTHQSELKSYQLASVNDNGKETLIGGMVMGNE